ncbi:hypothetical protein [Marinitoga lauensis]|nr:hypothetical protein [Marinitoga lauensis]
MVGVIVLTELFLFKKREAGFWKGLILFLSYLAYIIINLKLG